MAAAVPISLSSSAVRASSVDTQKRLPYNPHRTYPKKPDSLTTPATPIQTITNISISDLLRRDIYQSRQVEMGGTYLGYETWLPSPPKVEKPRSVFNPTSLAYVGDCIYELYARRHFLLPPLDIEEFNNRVMAVVRCEAQDAMLQKLINDDFLSQEERDVLRWGKNINSSKTRTKKRAGVAVYNRASSLETLVGYLYLTNVKRLEEIMQKMWPDLIQKAKEGGLDVIQTYVFWNGHEPEPGKYYFEERYDLVKFIKLVQQAGLYVHLRIGPYACAEWNFGGFPVWLKYVPGISFRTNNGPFKDAMRKFTTKIVNMMKAEKLYESQGGPIILSQIENEYGPVEYELGAPGRAYTEWAAKMAVDLDTGVPWIMCKQDDAPDPIIDTCNGFYCDYFSPNKVHKPKMWTEAWTGWFTEFGGPVPYRPAEDLAFSVAKFIQKRGSFINYYMYHGGTNFGRTSGGPFIATSYDYDAPLDEYGLLRQPKWGHLKDLHRAVKLCEPALVSGDPTLISLGSYQEAHIFKHNSGACAAFLANYDQHSFSKVAYGNMHYHLPPWSISILPDCKNTIYNTARIGAESAQMKMTTVVKGFSWQTYNEVTSSSNENSFTTVGLLEQINTTRDNTDYLWYLTEVEIDPNEGFLRDGKWPILTVLSAGHALHVFVEEKLTGTAYGSLENPRLTFSQEVKLSAGINKISLLSIAVGLPNVGPHFETWNAGVLGPVSLSGLNEGKRDLTWQKWSYKVGLKGEALNLHSLSGSSTVEWIESSYVTERQPLTWYKATFDAPDGNEPLAIDMNTMSKGQVWINGQSIGRYWNQYKVFGSNCGACNYSGWYDEKKCLTNCNEASQRWYHVPRSWLYSSGNLLVVFEEWGGNPDGILLAKREVESVCANMHEWQPTLVNWQMKASGEVNKALRPKAHLSCAPGQIISSIKFASFGTPEGFCGNFSQGSCHAFHSYDVFERYCVGLQSCSVPVAPEIFGGDPCPDVMKKLSVEAVCS